MWNKLGPIDTPEKAKKMGLISNSTYRKLTSPTLEDVIFDRVFSICLDHLSITRCYKVAQAAVKALPKTQRKRPIKEGD